MRWTPLLLLASACASTHAQPPPAPLSVSAEKAAGPADLPDAGVEDAGTPALPDGGTLDGGATRADLVSPITASGSETPAGLEWGEKGEEPAAKIFRNGKVLGVLKGMNARQFALIMGWFEQELGVECEHCHGKKGDFAADEPKKVRSREMLEMTSYIADGYYGGKSPVTCGTCHRGKAVPARTPGDKS